jgi:hypothetical protein
MFHASFAALSKVNPDSLSSATISSTDFFIVILNALTFLLNTAR